MLSDITPNAFMQQYNAVLNWYASNWSGVCCQLPNISKPNLIITGTEDVALPENLCLDIKIGVQLKLELANVGFYKFLFYMTIISMN